MIVIISKHIPFVTFLVVVLSLTVHQERKCRKCNHRAYCVKTTVWLHTVIYLFRRRRYSSPAPTVTALHYSPEWSIRQWQQFHLWSSFESPRVFWLLRHLHDICTEQPRQPGQCWAFPAGKFYMSIFILMHEDGGVHFGFSFELAMLGQVRHNTVTFCLGPSPNADPCCRVNWFLRSYPIKNLKWDMR